MPISAPNIAVLVPAWRVLGECVSSVVSRGLRPYSRGCRRAWTTDERNPRHRGDGLRKCRKASEVQMGKGLARKCISRLLILDIMTGVSWARTPCEWGLCQSSCAATRITNMNTLARGDSGMRRSVMVSLVVTLWVASPWPRSPTIWLSTCLSTKRSARLPRITPATDATPKSSTAVR